MKKLHVFLMILCICGFLISCTNNPMSENGENETTETPVIVTQQVEPTEKTAEMPTPEAETVFADIPKQMPTTEVTKEPTTEPKKYIPAVEDWEGMQIATAFMENEDGTEYLAYANKCVHLWLADDNTFKLDIGEAEIVGRRWNGANWYDICWMGHENGWNIIEWTGEWVFESGKIFATAKDLTTCWGLPGWTYDQSVIDTIEDGRTFVIEMTNHGYVMNVTLESEEDTLYEQLGLADSSTIRLRRYTPDIGQPMPMELVEGLSD